MQPRPQQQQPGAAGDSSGWRDHPGTSTIPGTGAPAAPRWMPRPMLSSLPGACLRALGPTSALRSSSSSRSSFWRHRHHPDHCRRGHLHGPCGQVEVDQPPPLQQQQHTPGPRGRHRHVASAPREKQVRRRLTSWYFRPGRTPPRPAGQPGMPGVRRPRSPLQPWRCWRQRPPPRAAGRRGALAALWVLAEAALLAAAALARRALELTSAAEPRWRWQGV